MKLFYLFYLACISTLYSYVHYTHEHSHPFRRLLVLNSFSIALISHNEIILLLHSFRQRRRMAKTQHWNSENALSVGCFSSSLASSTTLQGKKKRLTANVSARRKAKEFSLDTFIFRRNRLAEVFSLLHRQLRKLFWGGSLLLLDGCCHIAQLIKSQTTIVQMTGPEKRLTNEQQVTDMTVEDM